MQEVLEKKSIKNIDFNCDLAQAYGIYKNNMEFELLDYVSSVNVSCGFHAGDPVTIKEALLKAKQKNVAIGAHIGFNDIQGFGYRPVELKGDELEALVVYQVGALMSFAKAYGLSIEHVRPHGAMYKMAGEDFEFSASIAKAVKKCSEWLVYYAPVGDITERVAEETGVKVAREVCLELPPPKFENPPKPPAEPPNKESNISPKSKPAPSKLEYPPNPPAPGPPFPTPA